MNIQSKDWHARLDKMPGTEGPKFSVSGVINVPDSIAGARLVVSPQQDRSLGLRLDLHLEDKGIGFRIMKDLPVSFSKAGGSEITDVTIFYNKKVLARIDDVEVIN